MLNHRNTYLHTASPPWDFRFKIYGNSRRKTRGFSGQRKKRKVANRILGLSASKWVRFGRRGANVLQRIRSTEGKYLRKKSVFTWQDERLSVERVESVSIRTRNLFSRSAVLLSDDDQTRRRWRCARLELKLGKKALLNPRDDYFLLLLPPLGSPRGITERDGEGKPDARETR